MEVAKSSEMVVFNCNTARRHNPEDLELNLHSSENLKSLEVIRFRVICELQNAHLLTYNNKPLNVVISCRMKESISIGLHTDKY
jgi:hypothetical protein